MTEMIFLILRLLLVLVLCVAGVAKLLDRPGAVKAVRDMGLPESLGPFLGSAIPIVELAVAVALLPAASAWWGSLACFTLLAAFTVSIAVNLLNGRSPDCHCFGQLDSGPIGTATLIRNFILLLLAGILSLAPSRTSAVSAVSWFVQLTPGERALTAIGGAITGLLIAVVVLLTRLLHQNEKLTAAIAESRVPFDDESDEPVIRNDMALPSMGLPIGAPAPAFRLPDLDGDEVALEDLLRPGRPLALLFVSPGCAPCAAMLSDIQRWQEKYGEMLSFALITSGAAEENRAKFGGGAKVLLQTGSEVSGLFEARWTPAAVIVRTDGAIASSLASGSEMIRRAILKTLTTITSAKGTGAEGDLDSRIGEPAPSISLTDLDGATVSLSGFRGDRTLVVFWSPDCTFCEQMLEELILLEQDPPPHAPRLLLISRGSREANLAAGLRSPILLDDKFRAGALFGATGTPSAVLIDEEGRIASEVAAGAPHVMALAGRLAAPEHAEDALPAHASTPQRRRGH